MAPQSKLAGVCSLSCCMQYRLHWLYAFPAVLWGCLCVCAWYHGISVPKHDTQGQVSGGSSSVQGHVLRCLCALIHPHPNAGRPAARPPGRLCAHNLPLPPPLGYSPVQVSVRLAPMSAGAQFPTRRKVVVGSSRFNTYTHCPASKRESLPIVPAGQSGTVIGACDKYTFS